MAKQVSPTDNSLFVTLANGDEVRLDLAVRDVGSTEVTVTLTNGQTIKNCFWRDSACEKMSVDVNKVQKLIRFVYSRNQPAYQRILNSARTRLPTWIVRMSGRTMVLFYLSIPLFGWLMLPVLGRTAWGVLGLYTTLVMILTLGFTEQEIDTGIDFRRLESVAAKMLGVSNVVASESTV